MHEWKGWIWECSVIVYFHGKIEDAQIRYISFFHQTKINQNASLCGGFCSFDWKESRHICWGFLFSFCPQNWCHKSILLIINPQGHERGGPCQNIKISSWACHSLSLSYIDYLGSRLCRLDYIKCILANFLQPKNWFKIDTSYFYVYIDFINNFLPSSYYIHIANLSCQKLQDEVTSLSQYVNYKNALKSQYYYPDL